MSPHLLVFFAPPLANFVPTLLGLFGLAMTIFWVIVAWRAMRAHERLADAAAYWQRQQEVSRSLPPDSAENIRR